MFSYRLNAIRLSACALFLAAIGIAILSGSAEAQKRRVACSDPRVKDALILAVLERYKTQIAGRQLREVGGMLPGHAGFTPEGNSICAGWVNFQMDGRTVMSGTLQFEIYEDPSRNVIATLL